MISMVVQYDRSEEINRILNVLNIIKIPPFFCVISFGSKVSDNLKFLV